MRSCDFSSIHSVKISSSVFNLSIIALGRELVLTGATLQEIWWEGGVMSVGADPSDSL